MKTLITLISLKFMERFHIMARMYIYRNSLEEIVTINKDTRKLYILLNLNVERNKKFEKERNFYKVIIFNHLN